jgi:DNA-binding CsgD family transcriptional regulator
MNEPAGSHGGSDDCDGTRLLPLRVACGIGVADSVVALTTAVVARPDPVSIVGGIGWVLAWSLALACARPLSRAVARRPWWLVPVAAVAMMPALLDGGYPGNLATQPMWIALVAAAVAGWQVTVAVGLTLFAAKAGVFLATGTSVATLAPGPDANEATTAALAPLAVALLGLVLVRGLRRVLEAASSPEATGTVAAAPLAVAPAARLSPAERAVVALLAEGLTPKQIAHARGTSLATVRTQIKRAKRSTRARTLDELVATAWRPS